MFTFKIFEIPDGKSSETIRLNPESLDLGEASLQSGTVDIEFEKSAQFIRAKLDINVSLNLICDRSLESFEHPVASPYEILFKYDFVDESEDELGSIRNINSQRNEINIEQDVLDTILVHLPVKKLHPRFLDSDGNPVDFIAKSYGESEKDENTIDPRWAALKDLKK